jgi:small subunit ribosomal protein S5e
MLASRTKTNVQVNDMSVKDFIAIKSAAVYQPHTAGRYQKKRFRKAQCPIVERYAQQFPNKLDSTF